jgi:hypothetical protein
MANLENELRAETEKWLARIKERRKLVELKSAHRADYLKNLDAYISDSEHFLGKGDLIRAFEAVIWAWSLVELGEKEGFLSIHS